MYFVLLLSNMLREFIWFEHTSKIEADKFLIIPYMAGVVYIKYQLGFSASFCV